MNLAATASLLVAELDLKLVQDVIGAMRAADAAEGAAACNPLAPLPAIESPTHIHPEPVYENPRLVRCEPCCEPCCAPCCEPKNVCHTPAPSQARPRLALEPAPAEKSSHSHSSRWVITPPWAVLPWQQPTPAPAQIKVVRYTTDIVSKGSLIDVFI